MNFVYHSGEYLRSDLPAVSINNRGFHFGDGFFESLRVIGGKVVFFDSHFHRICQSLIAFKMDAPPEFENNGLKRLIAALIEKNDIKEGGRVRITVTRKATGFYLPHGSVSEIFIEAYPIEFNHFQLNQTGRIVDIYPEIKKQINPFSAYKTLNCLVYIMGSMWAKDNKLDDCLIQNDSYSITEATSSNIFIVSNGVLYTPPLESGCVGGTMRMKLINIALEQGIKVYEANLTPQNLLAADEIFLSNAINGIQWVSSYRTKRYFNDMSKKLIVMLNEYSDKPEHY